jgi:mono/diheme cytochrome c family protein
MFNSAIARRRVSVRTAVTLCAISGVSFAAGLAFAGAATTAAGAFTAAQAERGKVVYEKSCVNCHQVDFYRERLPKFEGQTVGALFESISTTMPADNVGSLLTSEYLDVIAHILSITGSPAGNAELTTDNMDAIKVSPVN